MTKQKTYGTLLLLLLISLSLFKDVITPDYLNTRAASFMNPINPHYVAALPSHLSHASFWIVAYLYSLLFVLLPAGIVYFWVNKSASQFTLFLLLGICMLEYVMILSGNTLSVVHIVPKINRYFHSPLLLLFLLASFTLYTKNDNRAN